MMHEAGFIFFLSLMDESSGDGKLKASAGWQLLLALDMVCDGNPF